MSQPADLPIIAQKRPRRWHILVFLLPCVFIYTVVMVLPLIETLRQAFFNVVDGQRSFVGFANFQMLFGDPNWSRDFWNALKNNVIFFCIHMLVQNPIGILLAAMLSLPKLRLAAFYRTAIFLPTLLSFVIVGFIWKLILSPIWGVAPWMMDIVGLKWLFGPWRQGRYGACHRVARLGLAVRRHPDDADLCGTFEYSR